MDKQLTSLSTHLPVPSNPRITAYQIFDLLDVSETTRDEYKYRISLFLKFIKDSPINNNSYLEFKRYLLGRIDFSISTKNKYLATAKIFLKELNRQSVLPVDITQNIKSFSQTKKHKKDGLNEGEMTRLVDQMKPLPPTLQNTRFKAIVALLALQGLRQIEITRLEVKDLDLVSKTALIRGKGRDDQEPVDLHPETIKTLRDYLKTNKKASGPLFTSQSNNSRGQRLTTRAIRKIVTGFLKQLGIEKGVHSFRHYFTTKLIKTYKGDLLEVAGYTRHRGLEMLQVYNDSIRKQADLPRYYETFKNINFN